MSEVSRLLFELGAGTLATVLGILGQCRAARHSRVDADADDGMTLEEIGLQLDALDAMIEAETEPAVRLRREDDQWRATIRQTLLDIDDLAALPDLLPPGYEEPFDPTPATVAASGVMSDPDFAPGERARVFMSTGAIFDGLGGSYSFLMIGNRGRQQLTIASGAPQQSILAAMNQFVTAIGLYGMQDPVNPDFIRMVSLRPGPRHFVAVRQLGGIHQSPFYDENRANPADRQIDFGA